MIYYDQEFGEVEVIFSRRKSISIGIKADSSQVVIKSGIKLTKSEVVDLITRHREWLRKKMAKINRFAEYKHTFTLGDNFMYLGRSYPLIEGERAIFSGVAFEVTNLQDTAQVKLELERIYRELARNYLGCHLKFTANKFKISYNQMRITSASTRWGSCTSKGNINFPWNLIMCPEELVDYVVCHELAHRLQMNHSAEFWREVERMCPNYRVFRKLLKSNSLLYANF